MKLYINLKSNDYYEDIKTKITNDVELVDLINNNEVSKGKRNKVMIITNVIFILFAFAFIISKLEVYTIHQAWELTKANPSTFIYTLLLIALSSFLAFTFFILEVESPLNNYSIEDLHTLNDRIYQYGYSIVNYKNEFFIKKRA